MQRYFPSVHALFFSSLIFLLFLLSSCQPDSDVPALSGNNLSGRILLWHDWSEDEAEILERALAVFQSLNRDVDVIVAAVPSDQLLLRYQNTAALGLGPDILLGSSQWVLPLANEGLIVDISRESQLPDTTRYVPSALVLLRYGEGLYGLPLSLRPPALYYNRELLGDTPVATTFDELLAQAAAGHAVALSTQAETSFMGIQAFGNPIFNDALRLEAEQDGFVAWLTWLKDAQESPGMILSLDEERLATLFMEKQVTYFITNYDRLSMFQEALNSEQDVVGTAPLPDGRFGQARPLIKADVLMFNSASSAHQRRLALALADFLTNAEQNNTFLRELGRVPANQRVRINSTVYPTAAAFAQQGRTAVAIPPSLRETVTSSTGDAVYTAVLSGAQTPNEAVCSFIQYIRQQLADGQPNFADCTTEDS